jgi:tetratricopeptide (TPR) repeat protein
MSRKDRYKKKMKAQNEAQNQTLVVQANIDTKPPSSLRRGSYVVTSQGLKPQWEPEVQGILFRLYKLSQSSPARAIPELLDMIERYPEVPAFQNYLSIAYTVQGNVRKANLEIAKTYQQFPDYLFAKAGYVRILVEADQLEKAAVILDGKFTISEHYPERNEFHLTELTAFNYSAGLYLLRIGQYAEAIDLYQEMRSIAPHDDITQVLRLELELADAYRILKPVEAATRLGDTMPMSFVNRLVANLLNRL